MQQDGGGVGIDAFLLIELLRATRASFAHGERQFAVVCARRKPSPNDMIATQRLPVLEGQFCFVG